ncbi:MAG: universal stress protein [Acidimicrobiia bacterium]
MTVVLAAIDDSAAARPVLATARAMAALWDVGVEALHIGDDGGKTAGAAAAACGVALRVMAGDVLTRLLEAASSTSVVAVVIGARGWPGGRRPAGHVALEFITRCGKPVIVVPPEASPVAAFHHVLVALEGTRPTSRALGSALELGRTHGLDVTVVHVDDHASIPFFSDQTQHETEAFATEFLARYTPAGVQPPLELRVGEPAEQVLSVCDDAAADLLVVAWSCSLAEGRARFVRHVLEHARIPVMLVPTAGG